MDTINEIKQKLDIVDVIGTYVQIKKSGRNYKGVCPFHAEKTPSFMVSQELQIFKCFGCGQSGDMFKFVSQVEGLEFRAALELLAEKAGVIIEKKTYDPDTELKKKILHINELTAKYYHHILTKHKGGKEGLNYFKTKRKLTDETINKFTLGYAPDVTDSLGNFLTKQDFSKEDLIKAGVVVERGGKLIDKFRGRVMFPFTGIDGKVLGFNGRTIFDRDPKYLNSPETPVFVKSVFLYGLAQAKIAIKHFGAVFVEGQMDVISAHQAGIENVIATSGTSLTNGQLRILSRFTKELTFCFDTDTAGVNAIRRAISMTESMDFNVRVAIIPPPYKDLDEMIQKDSLKAKELLSNPVSIYDFLLGNALKSFDTTSALGKKAIVGEITPFFTNIKSPIVLDHYKKKVGQELGLSEEAQAQLFTPTGRIPEFGFYDDTGKNSDSDKMLEYYVLALIMRTNLDTLQDYVYKLTPEDFAVPEARKLFETLKIWVEKNKGNGAEKLNNLEKELPEELKEIFVSLYMDERNLPEVEKIPHYLESSYKRLRSISIKNQLKSITSEIKIAELKGDQKRIETLTKSFNELSKERV